MVNPRETLGGNHVTMIHGPSPNHRIQDQDQVSLSRRLVAVCDFPDLIQKRFHTLASRSDEQLSGVLTYVLAQKIEALRNMRYMSFFIGELQASLFQECLNCRSQPDVAG